MTFETLQEVRDSARKSFENGETRIAPLGAVMAAFGWTGLVNWYQAYDVASGAEVPWVGPTGEHWEQFNFEID